MIRRPPDSPLFPYTTLFADETGTPIGTATGVTWTSDNPAVAAVAEDGTVSTAGYGHARVTATAPGGKHAAAEVFVQGEIVVASSRVGRFQLYSAERSNLAQLRKVVDDTASATEPAFSPDGSRIPFTSTRDRQPEIYVMDADGTNASRLTNSPRLDGDAAFTAARQSPPSASPLAFSLTHGAAPHTDLLAAPGPHPSALPPSPGLHGDAPLSAAGPAVGGRGGGGARAVGRERRLGGARGVVHDLA